MKFRLKTMRAAVTAAIGAAAAMPAFALPPTSYVPGTTLNIYLSGASAQDAGLQATIARLCSPGTLDRYDISSTQAAFLCTPSTTFNVGTATTVAIFKSSVAGSGNGVVPLIGTGAALSFASFTASGTHVALSTTTCPISGSSPTASITISGDSLGVPSYTVRSCNTTVTLPTSVKPDGGLSDVEPPLFTTKSTSSISAASANAVTFGVVVSRNLYRALQQAQSLDYSTTTADTSASSTITGIATLPVNDNEANMPSLTRDTIASLFSGQYATWDKLQVASGTSSVALTTYAGNEPGVVTNKPAPTDINVYVARRVPSSGTQKGSEIFFFGGTAGGSNDGLGLSNGYPAGCNATALGFLTSTNHPAADSETNCSTGLTLQTVFEGSGSGNVRNCIANHYADNRWAIGILSAETFYTGTNSQTAKNLRFIKIDGYSPSLLNVYTNKYKNWVAQSANKPTGYIPSTNAANGRDAIFKALGSQSVLKAVNGTLNQVWGSGALFALVENGAVPDPLPVTQSQVQANPGLPLTKALLGTTDNCQLPQYGTSTSGTPFPNQIN